MKFIHTADLHLDTPFEGLKSNSETPKSFWNELYQSPYQSFKKIVRDAIKESVDFILIVGDIFDSKNQSIAAISFFIDQMMILDKANIPVFLSFGNHDFQANGFDKFDFPKNVFVFDDSITTKSISLKNGETVGITGFSYATQAVTEDKVVEFPSKSNFDFQIGMVHGAIKTGENSNYAPFTIGEMLNKGYDYWALGHIHKRQELNQKPMIEYPGDIQGRHKNEAGEKGYLLINENQGELTKKFVPTSAVVFSNFELTIYKDTNVNDLFVILNQKLREQSFPKLNLINLILKTNETFNSEINSSFQNDILLSNIQSKLVNEYQDLNVWIYDIKLSQTQVQQFSSLDQEFWESTKSEVFNQANVDKIAQKLFKNDFIRNNFSDANKLQELLMDSESLLNTEIEGDDAQNEN
ncbi:DNA repair exonuclease [Fructilactobacillus vespulae]|uniref:metallophosphoesterase family protein n=1 Tax=Fructilactobacillus vespulae TaxID=1249630 RepID=UPI0039B3916E